MKIIVLSLLVLLGCAYAEEFGDVPSIRPHPESPPGRALAQIAMFDQTRLNIDVMPSTTPNRVLLVIFQLIDPQKEKCIELVNLVEIRGGKIRAGGRLEPVAGFSYPNLAVFIQTIEVDLEDGVGKIDVPEKCFKNLPAYSPYAMPFEVERLPPLEEQKQ